MSRNNTTIVASSSGKDAQGVHIITPASVISYINNSDPPQPNPQVYRTLAADNVSFLINPLWTRSVLDVALPVQTLMDHVSIHPALIRHWISQENQGGLFFPRLPFDTESRAPSIQILKHCVGPSSPPTVACRATGVLNRSPPKKVGAAAPSIQADLGLFIFRRELRSCQDLQPFDSAVWHPASYEIWVHMHTEFALILDEEYIALFPSGEACAFFRRMMHTHFADCGLLFGTMWWKFGLGEMLSDGLYVFMRGLLTDMFILYHNKTLPPTLPPLFNAVALGSGQRVCANCLAFRLGTGQMMRCPCHQVYYCSAACQKANWKVHRVMCGTKQ